TRLRRVGLWAEGGGALAEARFFQVRAAPLPATNPDLSGSARLPSAAATLRCTLPIKEAVGVTAIAATLHLAVARSFRAKLTLASEPERTWFQADLAPAQAGRLALVLDPPNVWCEAGDEVILTIAPRPGEDLSFLSRVEAGVLTASAEAVRDEFLLSRLNWFAAWYRAHAADAPWERADWDPDAEPAVRWLNTLRRWLPQHPGVIAYAARVQRVPFQPPVDTDAPPSAPAWAVYARHLLKQIQGITYWWRASRRQPEGLYGGDPGPDVTLAETLSSVALITGESVLRQSLQQDAEAAWERAQLPLHSPTMVAEWARPAAFALPLLLLLRPDTPEPLERCLQRSRPLREWMQTNPAGHSHFRCWRLLPPEGAPDPAAPGDWPGNTLAAGPAFAALSHIGHPRLQALLAEWGAAWAADLDATDTPASGTPPLLALHPHTCQPLPAPPAPPWFSPQELLARFLLDAYHVSGDATLLRAVRRSVREGWSGSLVAALWRSLGSPDLDATLVERSRDTEDELYAYAAWQATGNKHFVVEALRDACARLEKTRYLLTEAHPPPDTVQIPGDLLLRFLYLGGPAVWRGGLPRLALTWEETGADFAAFVAEHRP
ncbi:MAG: hypothetical protein QHJ73_16465, partial [Armatimonadota bacterium]|nr:hypothetical protein [Armatimonadota bacterium]